MQYFKPLIKGLYNLLELHSDTDWAKIMACEASISSPAKGNSDDLTGVS